MAPSAQFRNFAAVLILALCLSGCKPSQVISSLGAVVSAAEVAIPIIGSAAGLSPQTSALIVTYLQAVSTATGQASTILAGTGSTAQKTAQILAAFASVSASLNLPPGTPAAIVAVVNAVSQAVVDFLVNFSPRPALTAAKAAKAPSNISASDRKELVSIRARSDANLAKLKGARR